MDERNQHFSDIQSSRSSSITVTVQLEHRWTDWGNSSNPPEDFPEAETIMKHPSLEILSSSWLAHSATPSHPDGDGSFDGKGETDCTKQLPSCERIVHVRMTNAPLLLRNRNALPLLLIHASVAL